MSSILEQDLNVEMWKIKQIIKNLESARGNGTSMISLIIPGGDQIAFYSKMLVEEHGTASNIKSSANRNSVLSAIASVQNRLKLYNKVPPNGLVIYCGTIQNEGKEKKININFEPFKMISKSLYWCGNKFNTDLLKEMLNDDMRIGFIIINGNGALFATLEGANREILQKFDVHLPKKHGRGGQSALRFARLRAEKRHNYLRKVAEIAVEMFIKNDRISVSGLILAGSADFKNELAMSNLFDQRLQSKVIKTIDISYAGENGLNEAIELAAGSLANVKFIQEKRLIQEYFDEISRETGKFVYGVNHTLQALEMGVVEKLICWENLDIVRYEIRTKTGNDLTLNLQRKEKISENDFELLDSCLLLEWLVENYRKFGAEFEMVSDKSQEGAQFARGFGGIGAILRYRVDFQEDLSEEFETIDLDEY